MRLELPEENFLMALGRVGSAARSDSRERRLVTFCRTWRFT